MPALLVCVLASAEPAQAQQADTSRVREVEILHADSLAGEIVGGERIQRLVGNVALRQEATQLWADRVVRYLERDEILFDGNVRIVDEADTLWAASVRYDRRTKSGRARGDVRLSDGDVVVTAPTGLYFTREKRAVFDEGVTLLDSAAVLRSRSGEYWTEEKRAEFAGDVTLDESRTHLEADSVTYFRETEVSIARGDVFIERLGEADDTDDQDDKDDGVAGDTNAEPAPGAGLLPEETAGDVPGDPAAADTTTRTLLFGAYAYNDNRAGYSRIEGSPLLVQLRYDTANAPAGAATDTTDAPASAAPDTTVAPPDTTVAPPDTTVAPPDTTVAAAGAVPDTLLIRAVVLEATRIDSLQRLVAVDSVRIWQRELAAVADSVVYDRIRPEGAADSVQARAEARLFRNPLAWFEQSQVSGDTIRVKARDDAVDTLFVRGSAFVAQRDTALQRIHQLRGQHLVAVFRDDSLRTLAIGPNAEAVHFRSGDEAQADGAVQASADHITLYFTAGEVERINAVSGIEGTYYPEDQLPDPLRLDGYVWTPERRPTRGSLLGDVRIPARAAAPAPESPPPPEPIVREAEEVTSPNDRRR